MPSAAHAENLPTRAELPRLITRQDLHDLRVFHDVALVPAPVDRQPLAAPRWESLGTHRAPKPSVTRHKGAGKVGRTGICRGKGQQFRAERPRLARGNT